MAGIRHSQLRSWLRATKAARAASKVKMWRLHADILGDGQLETMVRLDHGRTGYPKPSCSYFASQQMLIDLHEPIAKAAYARPLFPVTSTLGNDLIYDSESKRYYVLEWNPFGAAFADREDAFVPNYRGGSATLTKGAKASVMVYLPLPQGPWPICWINWVPNHRHDKGPVLDNSK